MNKLLGGLLVLATTALLTSVSYAESSSAWRLAIRNVGGTEGGAIGQIADINFYDSTGDVETLTPLNKLYGSADISTTAANDQIWVTGDYTGGINDGDTGKTGAYTKNTTVIVVGTSMNNGNYKVASDAIYAAPDTRITIVTDDDDYDTVSEVPSSGSHTENYNTTDSSAGLTAATTYNDDYSFDGQASETFSYTATGSDTFDDIIAAMNADPAISDYGVASLETTESETSIVITSNSLGSGSTVSVTYGGSSSLLTSISPGNYGTPESTAGQDDVGETTGAAKFPTRDSASTNQVGEGVFAVGRDINAVFDDNKGSYFETEYNINNNNRWFVQYTIWPENGSFDVKQYTITAVGADNAPEIWELQRRDGAQWVTVETRGSQGWQDGETRTFVVGD